MSTSLQSISSHQVLQPEASHPVSVSSVRGAKVEDPSVQLMILILPTSVSPSVESPRIKDDRQSAVTHTRHLRSYFVVTNLTLYKLLDEQSSFTKEKPMEVVKQKDVLFPLPPEEKEEWHLPPHLAMLSMPSCVVMLLFKYITFALKNEFQEEKE